MAMASSGVRPKGQCCTKQELTIAGGRLRSAVVSRGIIGAIHSTLWGPNETTSHWSGHRSCLRDPLSEMWQRRLRCIVGGAVVDVRLDVEFDGLEVEWRKVGRQGVVALVLNLVFEPFDSILGVTVRCVCYPVDLLRRWSWKGRQGAGHLRTYSLRSRCRPLSQ